MERDSIPSHRLLVLMDLAKKEGSPLAIDSYVISEKLPDSK